MKWKCNSCGETEGYYCPCILEGEMAYELEYCPITGNECEWYQIKERKNEH